MSLPIAAAGPLKVATNPILTLSCAAAGVAASASTAAKPAIRIGMSLLPRAYDRPGAVLVPAPELLGGEIGALAQRLEFLPDHGVVHLGAVERLRGEAAVRCRDDVLAADQLG